MPHKLTRRKARKILREGEIGGESITKKQRGFFGVISRKGRRGIRKKSLLRR